MPKALDALRRRLIASVTGPTGKFPEGKLDDSDEGQLMMAVSEDQGKVRVDFGTEVKWFAVKPEQAREIGNALIGKADEIDKMEIET